MSRIVSYMCVVALASVIWSCSTRGGDPESVLKQAETSLQAFNFDEARAITEVLDSGVALLPSQLCRQALIYARLSEECDSPDDMDVAIRCYDKALAESPDSVRAFMEGLSIDDRITLSMLADIHHSLNNPESPTELDETADSIVSPSDAYYKNLTKEPGAER